MAFLDNSGDIILDAVLTDTGRYRLAQGNGSFKITKFALADDEIDYASYNKNHTSGSAYYDLEILQTPVLEAFTNNTSTMKSKLLSIPRTNLLYMPVILMNTARGDTAPSGSSEVHVVCCNASTVGETGINGFLVRGDAQTVDTVYTKGILNGFQPGAAGAANFIQSDQGLNTLEISSDSAIDADLLEKQYIVEIDNRLGSISSPEAGTAARVSFVDDDNIASYYFSISDSEFVTSMPSNDTLTDIKGPRGTRISFKIQASTELQTSSYLFEKLGSTVSMTTVDRAGAVSVRYIDTMIKVTGATTGYSLNLPVRFIRKA